ncbi:hypothetical protein GYMLUDRAFT_248493 [Collybiopsis luxurians FD-317 M1]|uniref:(2E,6E)-farnesyl diphosphate synthase n=1 Tax=Collybiopsis luxurians FD-317 M1 TaxID=944289 RepID=A0A0D0CC74_9AGAR|nr:hypothetical protein GYMLUDRAFT_248493 [Collybiopsis luxurians FD-317 M1]
MELLYSTIVDPSEYDSGGLCDGIDLRKSNFTWLEDRGIIRAQEDWKKYISPFQEFRGTLGPEYSFLSVLLPECLPERLEVLGYANEFAFLYDNFIEFVDKEQSTIEYDQIGQAFLEGARTGKIFTQDTDAETKRAGKRKMQSQMVLEMLAIDREGAIAIMKSWVGFAEAASNHKEFATLDEYLPFRLINAGAMVWLQFILFGMNLKIPENEKDKCYKLVQPALFVLALQNDLCSWEKEYIAAKNCDQVHIINALWVLMREYNTDVPGAQEICRNLIKKYISEYVQVVEDAKQDESFSADARKFVEASKYSIAGNAVWSTTCPRYQPGVSFNERQLEWMRNGVPNKPGPSFEPCAGAEKSRFSLNGASTEEPDSNPAPEEEKSLSAIGQFVVEAPYQYISSLPSKGVRDRFIDAVNQWLKVPHNVVKQIKAAINRLHHASLLLDDFQDSSPLRRGKPAAHTMFGAPQTINSAGYCIIKAIEQIQALGNAQIVTNKLLSLYKGQALDLHWTYNGIWPTPAEYIQMIDCKTGAQFDLVIELMLAHSDASIKPDLSKLTTLLGRYFQIADDYKNLVSADYAKQKGFCEDLDEGKYSLPLIHLMQSQPDNLQLRNILSTRRNEGRMMYEHKLLVLKYLKEAKSLEYTYSILADLHARIRQQIDELEEVLGESNTELRLLWELLRV